MESRSSAQPEVDHPACAPIHSRRVLVTAISVDTQHPLSHTPAILGLRPLEDPLTTVRVQRTQLAGPQESDFSPFLRPLPPPLLASFQAYACLGSNARKRPAKRHDPSSRPLRGRVPLVAYEKRIMNFPMANRATAP